ncbi:hypothetical protein ASG29_06580 [Sphingomonas sp. Leaf412]|nr:hypothetical protein ASG29_06580 [Sphingomonas sp. Leaf412]
MEREMWAAFAAISRKQGARLSLSAVARQSGHSRTMISHDGGDFPVLRGAILEEIGRRKPARAAKPTREEAEAIAEARRERKVNHWRAVAREADGRNAECMAAAVAAETRTERAHGVLRRILDDMVAGRWVRADPSAVLLGEIEVLLGSPVRTGAADAAG